MSKIADSFFARILLTLAVYLTLIGVWMYAPTSPRASTANIAVKR